MKKKFFHLNEMPMRRRRPFRKARPASFRSRRRRRFVKRVRRGRFNRVGAGNLAFPDTFNTKLRYTAPFQLTSAGVDPQEIRTFRLNSIWDPDPIVAPGATAAGWTQLNTIYGRYVVRGAKVRFTFTPDFVTAGSGGVQFAILPFDQGTFSIDNTIGEITGAPYAKYKNILTTRQTGPVTLSAYYNIRKISGYPYLVQDFISPMSANPTRDIRVGVYLTSLDSASDVTGWCTVDIVYYLQAFARRGNADTGLEE